MGESEPLPEGNNLERLTGGGTHALPHPPSPSTQLLSFQTESLLLRLSTRRNPQWVEKLKLTFNIVLEILLASFKKFIFWFYVSVFYLYAAQCPSVREMGGFKI